MEGDGAVLPVRHGFALVRKQTPLAWVANVYVSDHVRTCKCREEGGADGEAMRCYGWTRECSCFQLCGTREGLAIGGGGEKGYGLWLDTQLQVATSSSCTTYGNPSLLACAGAAPDGKATTGAIQELEVWTFAG